MAIYHLSVKVIQRSAGRSAVAAAAYRSASRLHDERLERDHDFRAKAGVVHSEILLPEGAPDRWHDRETLWNEVEARERQHNAQLAREVEIALPRELSRAEAVALARDFVAEQFVARGMVADLNVHWAVGADGEAQPHAHIMLTMRGVKPGHGEAEAGFGLKAREWNDRALLREWRQRWAEMANARLCELDHDARIDHRSNADQGIRLEPQNKIGPVGARRFERDLGAERDAGAERGEGAGRSETAERSAGAERGERAGRTAEHEGIARRNGERIAADPGVILNALTRQHSTFTRQDIARFVSRHTHGAEQFRDVMARVEACPEMVRLGVDGRGRDRFTTREMLDAERRMERAAADLDGRTGHAVAPGHQRAALAEAEAAGAGLGDEQRHAFEHVTRPRDLAVVVGYAGTGKSTMLGVARQAWEAQGYWVRGAALSGIAAENLESGSGIRSRTLAALEWGWQEGRGELTARDVLVVDEAGMIGSRQMERVLSAARVAGAKVVLVGDPEQLQAIEAGAAFRAIAERAGVAEIAEVRRQREGWQREATRELATGRTAAALDRYEAAGMVHGHATQAEAREALVAGWEAERRREPERSRLILAYTRADVAELNLLARERLRAGGELGPDVRVTTERGGRDMAAGDRIMFLRNERALGAGPGGASGVAVKNGTRGTLLAVDAGGERLTVRLDGPGAKEDVPVATFSLRDYAHVEHGYAATVHKSQGATVDRAHVLAGRPMDRHAAYVALTRQRDGVNLHWSAEELGDRAGLTRTLGRERAKDTSLDYGGAGAEAGRAAYAERRGFDPLRPESDIVAGERDGPGASGGAEASSQGARPAGRKGFRPEKPVPGASAEGTARDGGRGTARRDGRERPGAERQGHSSREARNARPGAAPGQGKETAKQSSPPAKRGTTPPAPKHDAEDREAQRARRRARAPSQRPKSARGDGPRHGRSGASPEETERARSIRPASPPPASASPRPERARAEEARPVRRSVSLDRAEAEFRQALREAGLRPRRGVHLDGKLHYSEVDDGGKKKRGTYVVHMDGWPAGTIINHRTGVRIDWRASADGREATAEEAAAERARRERARAGEEEARARRAREDEAKKEAAAQVAAALWAGAKRAPASHAYLTAKGVSSHGTRVAAAGQTLEVEGEDGRKRRVNVAGRLLVPMRDAEDKLWNLQMISPDGTKMFLPGGRILGTFHMLGEWKPGEPVGEAEGFATGATGTEATGLPVAVAFNATNLKPVAAALRARDPVAPLAVLGDNDHHLPGVAGRAQASAEGAIVVRWPEGATGKASMGNTVEYRLQGTPDWTRAAKGVNGTELEIGGLVPGAHYETRVFNARHPFPLANAGAEKAREAAEAVGGVAVLPDFARGDPGTDWNDFARRHGLDAAREALEASLQRHGITMSDTTKASEAARRAAATPPAAQPPTQAQRDASRSRPRQSSAADDAPGQAARDAQQASQRHQRERGSGHAVER